MPVAGDLFSFLPFRLLDSCSSSERIFMKSLAGETEGAETTTTTTGLWLRVVNCAFRSHCSSSISINLRRFSSLVRTYFGSISSRARQRHLLLRSSPVSEREREKKKKEPVRAKPSSLSPAKCLIYILFRPNMACVRRWLLNSQFSS